MIASERRIVSEGETRHSLTKKLALSGRPVKIYVIDPKQFGARLQKYVGPEGADVKKSQKFEEIQQQKTLKNGFNKSMDCRNSDEVEVTKVVPSEKYKMSHPVLIAPKESMTSGTTIILPPTTTLLQMPMIPVSLSLPIMSVGTTALGAAMGNMITVSPSIISGARHYEEASSNAVMKKKVKKKKPVKRKLTAELSKRNSISEEKAEAAEMAFLMKESTTRTGRVSKSNTMASAVAAAINGTLGSAPGGSLPGSPRGREPSPAPSTSSVASVGSQQENRAKKREPPEKFRCQTCQKFYLGNAKFNQHFDKFPDHVKPDPNVGVKKKAKTSPKTVQHLQQSVEVVEVEPMNTEKNTRTENENQHSSPKHKSMSYTHTASANIDEDSLGIGGFSPIMRRSVTSVPNPDTLSDNCSSPKLPAFSIDSSPTMFIQRNGDEQLSHNLQPSQHLPSGTQHREYFMEFQTDFNNSSISMSQLPSELINGSCSQQSFNSLENLLAESNSHLGQHVQSTSITPPPTSRNDDVQPPRSNTCNKDVSTFFSAASTSNNATHHLHNSSVNVSSYVSVNSCSIPLPAISASPLLRIDRSDEESRDACLSNSPAEDIKDELESCGRNQSHPNDCSLLNQPKRRSIWEFVKEQIRLCGINQTCGEITEMADKLSKIARDKFYPIQEEEVERLGTASPVIQVDTPFVSHLLDLPFGKYIFKEDGGIRKIVPPPTPVSTELSLTNGVEVDMDKFLSPDIDLISLPHLTNLDFNSICN